MHVLFYSTVITKKHFEREKIKCLQDNNCFYIYEMTRLFFTCNSVKSLRKSYISLM